jgi:hypothetical protein
MSTPENEKVSETEVTAANEIINPKQANNQRQIRKDAEERKKIRVIDEKILTVGNKKVKKIRYERLINGKYVKGNTKVIYLGKKGK